MRVRARIGLPARIRPRSLLPSLLVAVAAAGILASSGSSADGARLPRLTTYEAELDVAGFVLVRATRGDTADCEKGRDIGIDYRADFELRRPQKVTVVVGYARLLSVPARKAGGAVHEGEVFSYRESNDCPPKTPVVPGKPTCTKLRGTLEASLVPTLTDDVELSPLTRGVSIALGRVSGGTQEQECRDFSVNGLKLLVAPGEITTLETTTGIIVPLGVTDATFARLRPGRAIRRLIELNGACNGVLLSSGPAVGSAARASSNCTVSGKIYVSVRRVR